MSLKLNVIVAACDNMGIGYKNALPWKLRKEMAYFARMTTFSENPGSSKKNVVLMGRRTWESIPEKFRPLKNRVNIVLSRGTLKETPSNVSTFKSWDEAIQNLSTSERQSEIDKVWVIGGCELFKMAMESSLCYRIYLTRIMQSFECDVFLPEFDKEKFRLVNDENVSQELQEEDGIQYRFEVYERLE
jgi:dihydrofolate reductase